LRLENQNDPLSFFVPCPDFWEDGDILSLLRPVVNYPDADLLIFTIL